MNLVVLIINYVVVQVVKEIQVFHSFILSLEDDLMKRAGSDAIQQLLESLKIEGDDVVIQSRMIISTD